MTGASINVRIKNTDCKQPQREIFPSGCHFAAQPVGSIYRLVREMGVKLIRERSISRMKRLVYLAALDMKLVRDVAGNGIMDKRRIRRLRHERIPRPWAKPHIPRE